MEAGAAVDADARAAVKEVSKYWWLWLVCGIGWTIIAVVILQFDQASINTVGVLVGLMFFAAAIQQFAFAGLVDHGRWLLAIFGVLFSIAGVFALISPENTFAALADMLGFLFLLVGVFWILQAFGQREINEFWWLGLIAGPADGRARVLDRRPVLHREAVRAAGLRRHLGADAGLHRHRQGIRRAQAAATSPEPTAGLILGLEALRSVRLRERSSAYARSRRRR